MFARITSSFGFKCRRALARKAAEAAGRQALAATRIQAGFRGALARAQLVLQVKGTANTDCHSACWPWSPRVVFESGGAGHTCRGRPRWRWRQRSAARSATVGIMLLLQFVLVRNGNHAWKEGLR